MFSIVADLMTETQFSYICPVCNNRHYHGNNRDMFRNRTEYRQSHCLKNPRELSIIINENTRRDKKR